MIGGPRTLSAFVPKLTSKAFEKHGFPASALLMDWAEIAGPDLSSFTRPEKLNWPRRPHADQDEVRQNGQRNKRAGGATLVLRVDGPRAIEVQHSTTQIKEQINAYFGYNAVTELRFLQAPITSELPRKAIASKASSQITPAAPIPENTEPASKKLASKKLASTKPVSKLDATLARLAENLELAD